MIRSLVRSLIRCRNSATSSYPIPTLRPPQAQRFTGSTVVPAAREMRCFKRNFPA